MQGSGADLVTQERMMIPINNDLADYIVGCWLLQHMDLALDTYESATIEEDKAAAAADILAFERIYHYVTGERALEKKDD